MEEEKKEKGFVIKDRRLFGESGASRDENAAPTEEKGPSEKTVDGQGHQTGQEPSETEDATLPEINFAGFIISLSTTAMYHFGDFPDPVTKETRRNLPAAKQTVDILSILKKKTEGNLDDDERQLLDGILYELRMRFVKEMTEK